MVDFLLPLIATRRLRIRSPRALSALHRLLAAVAPIALRPPAILLRTAFEASDAFLPVRGFNRAPSQIIDWQQAEDLMQTKPQRPDELEDEENNDEAFRSGGLDWLPCLIVMLKVLGGADELSMLTSLQSLIAQRDFGGSSNNSSGSSAGVSASSATTSSTSASASASSSPSGVWAVFGEFLFVAIRVVAQHFTRSTTVRSELLGQQFSQLLQYTYALLSRSSRSGLLAAARDVIQSHGGSYLRY